MVKIEITQNHGKHRVGQIVEMDEFGMGHALAFKYGKIFIPSHKNIEKAIQDIPETTAGAAPIKLNVESKAVNLFRRGRRKK